MSSVDGYGIDTVLNLHQTHDHTIIGKIPNILKYRIIRPNNLRFENVVTSQYFGIKFKNQLRRTRIVFSYPLLTVWCVWV